MIEQVIRERLAAAGDEGRARAQQRYMKSSMPFHGVALSAVRAVVGGACAEDPPWPRSRAEWDATVLGLWDGATHREDRYAAIAVARHRRAEAFRQEGALPLYRHLIETGAWWDLVDEVATHLVRDELLADPDRVASSMREWATVDDLWVRRAAILCQVGAGDAVDLRLLEDVILANLEGSATAGPQGRQDFFVRKAIGWALRDVARRYPEWVVDFVHRHGPAMAGLTRREATKHLAR